MSSKNAGPFEYVLVGPRAGQSGEFGSIKFTNGRAIVSGLIHENIGHLLRNDYSAKLAEHCTPKELGESLGAEAKSTTFTPAQLKAMQEKIAADAKAEALRELARKQAAEENEDVAAQPQSGKRR